MVPWWSSNPSTLSGSMESIDNSDGGHHHHVQPVQSAPAADAIDGGAVVVVVGQRTAEESMVPSSTAVLAQSVEDGIFGSVQQQQIRPESYEEAKRLLVFAGLFFLLMSAFVLIKFQVAIDDIFRWSPAVWLIGVIICALLMNLSVQIRRFIQRIKENRIRERQNLLYSLNLSNSLSNLSPSQLHEHFCWRHRQRFYNANMPPTYDQIDQYLLASPPAFVVNAVNANANTQIRQQQQQQQRHKVAPPKYKSVADNAHSSSRNSRSSSEEDISPPSYEQCQNGVP